MSNINYATLAKQINGVIEYIYPKTVASIVEYTEDVSVEEAITTIKGDLGNIITRVAEEYYNKTEIDGFVSDLYSAIRLNSVTVTPKYAEIGSAQVTTVKWDATKKPKSLIVNGEDKTSQVSGETGEIIYSGVTTERSFNVTVSDGVNNFSASDNINFVNKIYYGPASDEAISSSANVLRLLDDYRRDEYLNEGSKSKEIGYVTFNDKYFYYCYPKRLGTITATANGVGLVFNAPTTLYFTNAYGSSEDYYVYRSTNKLNGTLYIIVN